MQEQGYEKSEFISRELSFDKVEYSGGRKRRNDFHIASKRHKRLGRRAKKHSVFAIKAGICVAVALCCAMLRFLPWQWVKDTRQAMSALFTYDLEFDETLGRLKFVQVLFPGVAAVFGSSGTLYYPVDGILQTAYGADGQDHVVFKCEAGASVKAAADGSVIKRGVNETYGNYLMIEHASDMVTIYYGLGYSILEKGAQVKGGDVIATLTDSGELVFELRIADAAQNPIRYLGAN